MITKFFLFFFTTICLVANCQQNEKNIYIKVNPVILPILLVNGGVEFEMDNKHTIQTDIFISPWKSIDGKHAEMYLTTVEARHYFDESFRKFYLGANLGGAYSNLTKWDYWYQTGNYQKSLTFLAGITLGYQFFIKEKWNLDVYLGAGTVQSFYYGFRKMNTGLIRYDAVGDRNASGEFLPYKAGFMLSYKLK